MTAGGCGEQHEREQVTPPGSLRSPPSPCGGGITPPYFSAGATATSPMPLAVSEAATKPDAFISSTKPFR